MSRSLQFATLILAASVAAVAQTPETRIYQSGSEWIQEVRGSLPPAKIMKVISFGGSIRVQGAQQNNITFVARERIRANSEGSARHHLSKIRFTASPGEIATLRAECDESNHTTIDFEVQVPAQIAGVTLRTEGGAVSARGLSGKLEVVTGGGDVNLDQIGGAVHASSDGGNVEIGKVGSNLKVWTGGGNIHVEAAGGYIIASSEGGNLRIGSGKAMQLKTEGGLIRVQKCEGQLDANTGGGNLELIEVAGPARVKTSGGGIKVGSINGGLYAETDSGAIIATLSRGDPKFSESRLQTDVGDIVIYIPDGLGVNIRAAVEVARGRGIDVRDFPQLKVISSTDMGPKTLTAEGSLYGGGPVLRVSTETGSIAIKRKGKE